MERAETYRYVRMRTLEVWQSGLRTFMFGGVLFAPERDWVRVSEQTAAYLAQLPNDPGSPLPFEVWEPPPAEPEPRAVEVDRSLACDAEGADVPSGRPLPSDAPASAETHEAPEVREVQEIAEGGSPSPCASARDEGSPPDVVPHQDDGDAPTAPGLQEIAEGGLPSPCASARGEGSPPRAVTRGGRREGAPARGG